MSKSYGASLQEKFEVVTSGAVLSQAQDCLTNLYVKITSNIMIFCWGQVKVNNYHFDYIYKKIKLEDDLKYSKSFFFGQVKITNQC